MTTLLFFIPMAQFLCRVFPLYFTYTLLTPYLHLTYRLLIVSAFERLKNYMYLCKHLLTYIY